MEEKRFTEKESIELITSMIENTKKRLELGAGNILLAWGYVVTIVALTVGIGFYATRDINWYWLWFAIPVIGYPLHYVLSKQKEAKVLVKTSIDKFLSGIWAAVGAYFLLMMLVCLGFGLNGYNAWGVMFLLTLPCCGFGTVATGVILREKTLLAGGFLSMLIGGVFIICYMTGLDIFGYDIFAFAFCFAVMMIVPGHVINHKVER